ncbi:MAG TPA: glycerate kinase [Candidatus Kapabacteria bacterium]|nr:glycerate kinase [Candidatus Kapabacteria bacterium]
MMHGKTLAIALPFPGLWDAGEAAALLARFLRAADRERSSAELVTMPWLDGGNGTIDFLVTQTLGSFLEVEVTGASGEDLIVPIGFAGEDGKLAVIEMARAARVHQLGEAGTTAGVGELIQDALDEGAFSILLCQEEPVACDAGFGAAAALGVRFFDLHDKEIVFSGGRRLQSPSEQATQLLSRVARIDGSGRSFALLSSRIYIARSAGAIQSSPSPEILAELARLAEIIQRDAGVPAPLTNLSASAVEFGLIAFLGAEARDGEALVLEASRIEEAIGRGEFSEAILLASSVAELDPGSGSAPLRNFLEHVRERIPHRAAIVMDHPEEGAKTQAPEPRYSLAKAPVFQAPVRFGAGVDDRSSTEERRRDFSIRLEKLLPVVLDELRTVDHPGTKPRAK